MTLASPKGCAAALLASCALNLSACDDQRETDIRDNKVYVTDAGQHHELRMNIAPLRGKCYAPRSYLFNGALRLDDLNGSNLWLVTPVTPDKVESLGAMLAAPRVRISSGNFKLLIPKDSILLRPFHFQFVAFPCDAPRALRESVNGVDVVSLAADLPLYYPPGYRPGMSNTPTGNDALILESLGPPMANRN